MTRDMLEKWQQAAIEAYKQGKTDVNPTLTQNVFLSEIALQLAKQHEELVKIAKSLDQLVEFKAIS